MQDTPTRPPRPGIAGVITGLSSLLAGAMRSPAYQRKPVPPPETGSHQLLALDNVSVLDVDAGRVRDEHTDELIRLPMHHRDPFDRLLVAQARGDALTVVTSDERMRMYDAAVLEAGR